MEWFCAYRYAVIIQRRPLSFDGCPKLASIDFFDDANNRFIMMLKGHTNRKMRQSIKKICGAIQWVDTPSKLHAFLVVGVFFCDESTIVY